MTAYIIRRLLLMIPTFFGILCVNFVVLRLQAFSLTDELSATAGETVGERKVGAGNWNLEAKIDRFRRTGNDLPALLNTHGFLTKDRVTAWLRATAPDYPSPDSTRNRQEKELWLVGALAVRPLAEILRDESLVDLHGPASQALALCAYTSIEVWDLDRLPPERLRQLQNRNRLLRTLVISYRQTPGKPFVSDDPQATDKRTALLAVVDDSANAVDFSQERRWSALVLHTGFVDFLTRLATADLWSETKKEGAFAVIGRYWQTTFGLNVLSILIAWTVAVPLGIRSARRAGTLEDTVTTNTLFLLWSLPSFFVGTLLLHHLCTSSAGSPAPFPNKGLADPDNLWFSTPLFLLDYLWHGFLPLLTLSYASFVSLSRYLRGNLLEQMGADYVRTARAKGVSEDVIVYRHAFRNSSLTLITLSSGLLAELFGGVLIVEMIFSINGLGMLLLDAARQQDAPLILASTVVSVGLLLIGILIADILYAVVDPRIRSRYV